MARRRREPYFDTDGALALQGAQRDYQEAARRYVRRDAQARQAPKAVAKPKKRFFTIVLVLIFFAAAFFLLFRQAGIEQQIVKLHDMRTELKEEEQRGEDLRLELSLKLDIDNVQRTAKEDMQMRYPDVEMTRSIQLPPILTNAAIETANAVVEEDEPITLSSWLADIVGKFAN